MPHNISRACIMHFQGEKGSKGDTEVLLRFTPTLKFTCIPTTPTLARI